ncbi:helix-turn-helix domain-containing protein [Streptomyces sp. Li-HN-5-11]|uniref:TetR/AcrR family transcriptional regulator n=1 Tax=Streptomyces sp. Li-HN-5-11 TaxID=3075432 RepID=UPI0028A921C7|nr:helix-turn-helix domain-containing protein [Streptomyces sp. Li-HN-5-11]WNM33699.1 helix-turn-helix domain-containing protein [Streptomyces sp. Li-HN-5-11]
MAASPSTQPPLVLPGTRTGRDPERSLRRGPRRISAEAVAANQRDRLLDGFVRTVAQVGYARTRVSDICKAAGVTRPVFYELFEGKEDAFLAAHHYGTSLVFGAMEEAHAHASDWPSRVRAGLGALLGILAEAPAFAAMAIVEIDAVGPAGREAREELLARFRDFFTDLPEIELPIRTEELVDTVVGGVYSAIYRRIAADRTAELPDLLPGLAFSVLAPFLGPERATACLTDPAPPANPLPACLTPET